MFVIGGAELYAAALPLADELLLTEIDMAVDGDTVFPPFDRAECSRKRRASPTCPRTARRSRSSTYVRRPGT